MAASSSTGVGRAVEGGGGEGEYLVAGRGDADRMLELRRERAVLGDGGPAVVENLHLPAAGIDHRLDGKDHALAHHRSLLGGAEMEDRRRIVEDAADAVAAEIAHHREALRLGEALDRLADGADAHARPHR